VVLTNRWNFYFFGEGTMKVLMIFVRENLINFFPFFFVIS
jgi:hypothetical protein